MCKDHALIAMQANSVCSIFRASMAYAGVSVRVLVRTATVQITSTKSRIFKVFYY